MVEPAPCPGCVGQPMAPSPQTDRKSTRLNSSHLVISYAVFCLKKKNAKFDAIPRSALRSGFVDLVFAPDAIACQIQRQADHRHLKRRIIEPYVNGRASARTSRA